MTSIRYLLYACLVSLATCYLVDPPTTAANDTIQDCTNWVVVTATDTCTSIASSYAITLQQFEVEYVSTRTSMKVSTAH
jgi:hypothetical protein